MGCVVPAPLVDLIRCGARVLLGEGLASLGVAAMLDHRQQGNEALARLQATRMLLSRLGWGGETCGDVWLGGEHRDALAAAIDAQITTEADSMRGHPDPSAPASRILVLAEFACANGLPVREHAPELLRAVEEAGPPTAHAGARETPPEGHGPPRRRRRPWRRRAAC